MGCLQGYMVSMLYLLIPLCASIDTAALVFKPGYHLNEPSEVP